MKCPSVPILLLLISLQQLNAADADASQPPMLGKLVDVGGYRVHLYCTGEGKSTIVVASGGFSFEWGLVQPELAKSARVCTYDPAGMAWSDTVANPHPSCADRVRELHALLTNAGVEGPYVLVGFSIGGLVARLYAIRYPNEIAGIAFVDHAFVDTDNSSPPASPAAPPGSDSPPVLIYKAPITLDLEDDQNFSRLPARDQALHRWALSIRSVRPTPEMAAGYFSEVDAIEQSGAHPLGNIPVAVVSTLYDSPRYAELQHKLLLLSRNSKQFIAKNSSHMVIIDQPDIVVRAIQQVIQAARNGTSLRARP